MLRPVIRSSHRVHCQRASCGLLFLLTASLCSSCATPAIRPVESGTPVLPVVAAGGALSERGSERLVEKRLGPQQGDEHVRELKETRELSVESWRQRPFTDKLKEFASSLFSYWL